MAAILGGTGRRADALPHRENLLSQDEITTCCVAASLFMAANSVPYHGK
jgi:hypothetical protein